MVNFLWFLGCSNPNSVCKMEISHLRGVLNSIVHQYYDSGSKKSLIHSHPASILVVIFSDWWCKLFQEYHGKRKTEKTDFYFNFSFNANFVKISILSFSLGGKLKKKWKQEFWSETFAFLGWLRPHFGLYASDVYGSKLHIFTYGKKSFNDGLQCSL